MSGKLNNKKNQEEILDLTPLIVKVAKSCGIENSTTTPAKWMSCPLIVVLCILEIIIGSGHKLLSFPFDISLESINDSELRHNLRQPQAPQVFNNHRLSSTFTWTNTAFSTSSVCCCCYCCYLCWCRWCWCVRLKDICNGNGSVSSFAWSCQQPPRVSWKWGQNIPIKDCEWPLAQQSVGSYRAEGKWSG